MSFDLNWQGMPINTVSTVSANKAIKIDRCVVRCYRTLYGDIYYIVEGTIKDGVWYPISHEFKSPEKALDFAEQIEKQIKNARINDQFITKGRNKHGKSEKSD